MRLSQKGVVLCIALLFIQGINSVAAASNWAQTSTGTCAQVSQCLVSNAFSTSFDNIPTSYWDGLARPANGPKCIASGQFILDHYCDNGVWSSRTKLVAERLLSLAVQSGASQFSVSCGPASQVLPHDELTSFGSAFSLFGKSCTFLSFNNNQFIENCGNNVCVLRYGSSVAVGLAVNSAINGPESVLRAFNLSPSSCASAIDSDAEYASCGANFWYDHRTQSLIYAPGAFHLPLTAQQSTLLGEAFGRVNEYVSTQVNNPLLSQKNYSSFDADLSEVFYAQSQARSMFAFRQSNLTLFQKSYLGMYIAGVALPSDSCAHIFKRFDDRSQCEVQPTSGMFFLVAAKSLDAGQGIVDAYPALVSLRVVS